MNWAVSKLYRNNSGHASNLLLKVIYAHMYWAENSHVSYLIFFPSVLIYCGTYLSSASPCNAHLYYLRHIGLIEVVSFFLVFIRVLLSLLRICSSIRVFYWNAIFNLNFFPFEKRSSPFHFFYLFFLIISYSVSFSSPSSAMILASMQ